jgi:hypothetical protein
MHPKKGPSIMAEAATTPPVKTVAKPRDQHLRDLADCIRFLSMDAVQQAKSGHAARRARDARSGRGSLAAAGHKPSSPPFEL